MSKAQTDIRTTSYDELAARPLGYQGTIEDVLAQIRAEPDEQSQRINSRSELLNFLNVPEPRVGIRDDIYADEDWSVEYYDAPQPENKFSLAYGIEHGFIPAGPVNCS